MLDPALLALIALGGGAGLALYWRYRLRIKPSFDSNSTSPTQASIHAALHHLPSRPHFDSRVRAMEEVHVSTSGAIALNASGPARVRPGHRCIEEVRRRCNADQIGAIEFLESQLNQRISENPLEQIRYWIDVAEGLRNLNLHDALPGLLRRADEALDLPLGEHFAAEVVSFASFAEYLHDPLTAEGQAALRILRVAMEGVRLGRMSPTLCVEGAFGDAVRRLAESYPNAVNPRLALVFVEAMRHCRRSFHKAPAFRDDPIRRQTARWQQAFLKDAEPVMREYLHDIGSDLICMLDSTTGRARREILQVLLELRTDSGAAPLEILSDPDFIDRPMAIRALRWSQSPLGTTALSGIVRQSQSPARAARWLQRIGIGKQVAKDEVIAALTALRGHACEDVEKILMEFAKHTDVELRQAALQSLGWWEPVCRNEVLATIQSARQDSHPDIRRTALACAARLGECAALQTIRDSLQREHPVPVLDAIRLCAQEGLSWLWPELDLLTESDESAIADEAWDAIERMREDFMGLLA
jgi:hypothetical protein